MSNFTPTVPFEMEFEGDTVTARLKRLTKAQALKMNVAFSNLITDAQGNARLSYDTASKESGTLVEILKECVTEFAGLRDSNGDLIPFDVVLEQQYFAQITGEIVAKLVESSKLFQKDKDTLGKPPANDTGELSTMTS